jgi:hypothetical protein
MQLPPSEADYTYKHMAHALSFKTLDDFCEIPKGHTGCFRHHVAKDLGTHRFSWSRDRFISYTFPEKGLPMSLYTALTQHGISPRHRIFLAFSLSKAIWQYYDSKWMDVEWTLNSLQLLQTDSPDSEVPFLSIRSARPDQTGRECELERSFLHRYPYIFNLGLLLVQLGSINRGQPDFTEVSEKLTGIQKSNQLCISCCNEIRNQTWPAIGLPTKVQTRYRRIVEQCLPISRDSKPLFDEHLDAAGRKSALRECVVLPLLELIQDMTDPEDTLLLPSEMTRRHDATGFQVDVHPSSGPKSERYAIKYYYS